MLRSRVAVFAILILLVWAIVATGYAAYYYWAYEEFSRRIAEELKKIAITADIAIDYGNKTRVWYNDTLLPLGISLFNATLFVAKVDYEYYPEIDAVFIEAINDVRQDPVALMYWTWYYWDVKEGKWELGPVASNKYILRHGEKVIWYYAKFIEWTPKPPD